MKLQQNFRAGLLWPALASTVITFAGCQGKAPPPDAPPPPPPVSLAPTTAPSVPSNRAEAPPVHGTADLLADKASSYAKNMEAALAKRNAPPDKSVAGAVDPTAMRLNPPTTAESSPTNPQPQQIASAAPVVPGDVHASTGAVTPVVSALTPPRDATLAPVPPKMDDGLAKRLAQHVHDDPQDLAGHLDFQLFQMLNGEAVPQLTTMSPLSPEDRELVSAIVDGLNNFRDGARADSNMLLSRKVKPLLEMADRVRNQAELSIPTIALCRRVDRFGVYEPIAGQRFLAGQEQPVIVYCEVENFGSQLNEQKMWETKLKQEVVLYTEQNGLEVWRDKQTRPVVDLSRNRRHDFFMAQMIRLPASLTIGRYLLKVSVEDLHMNRIAENTVAIEIVAQ